MNRTILISVFSAIIAVSVIAFVFSPGKDEVDSRSSPTLPPPVDESRTIPDADSSSDGSAIAQYGFVANSGKPSVLEIQWLADRGNAAAQRVLSEIYSDCQMYSLDHDVFVATVQSYWKTSQHMPPKVEKLLDDLKDMCDQVDGGDVIPGNAASAWRIQAAQNGDRIAQVHDAVMRFDQLEPSRIRHLVDSVIQDGDPSQLLALSELMSRQIPLGDSNDPALSGSPMAAQSWAIAACRRGADCGPLSRTMRFNCLMYGLCESASYEDFIFSHLVSPADRVKVEQLVGKINQAIDEHGG